MWNETAQICSSLKFVPLFKFAAILTFGKQIVAKFETF